ncbi:hypothetical protein F750_2445 [Streptomyces sp. PAMC 26508]|nr:hypothetical protein F750_2445 [Streptomyces sp. PAMC 26508]
MGLHHPGGVSGGWRSRRTRGCGVLHARIRRRCRRRPGCPTRP